MTSSCTIITNPANTNPANTNPANTNPNPAKKGIAQALERNGNTYFLQPQLQRSQASPFPADPRNSQGNRSCHSNVATTLVVVDANLDYSHWLATKIADGAELLILQPNCDGVEQISQAMKSYGGAIQHLHILAGGAPACLYLGNTELSLENLPNYRLHLLIWFMNRLRWASDTATSDGDDGSPECLYTPACTLSFYACRVAAGEAGSEFLQRLHYLTGAQIAASTQPIGNQVLGGTWQLDTVISDRVFYAPGVSHPVPNLPIDPQTLAAYPALLSSLM